MKSSIDFDSIRACNPLLEYCRKRGIELRKNGTSGRLVGLCPLHQEKTPSFHVYLDDDHYYCFGCRVHGDVIDLEQALGGGTHSEAIKRLTGGASSLDPPSMNTPAWTNGATTNVGAAPRALPELTGRRPRRSAGANRVPLQRARCRNIQRCPSTSSTR